MFRSNLREMERRPLPEMQRTEQILAHFAHQIVKSQHNACDPPFEEEVLRRILGRYSADFPHLGAYLKPNHLMANYISLELSRGKAQIPTYTPFIVPTIAASPGPVLTAERKSEVARRNSGRHSVKSPDRSSSH